MERWNSRISATFDRCPSAWQAWAVDQMVKDSRTRPCTQAMECWAAFIKLIDAHFKGLCAQELFSPWLPCQSSRPTPYIRTDPHILLRRHRPKALGISVCHWAEKTRRDLTGRVGTSTPTTVIVGLHQPAYIKPPCIQSSPPSYELRPASFGLINKVRSYCNSDKIIESHYALEAPPRAGALRASSKKECTHRSLWLDRGLRGQEPPPV